MNENLDPTDSGFNNEELEIDKALRPLSFDDFAGQECSGRAAAGQVGAHVGCAEPNLELRRPSWRPWRAA